MVASDPFRQPSILPVSNLLVAIMTPRLITRSDRQCDCSSRRYMDSSRMSNEAGLTGRIGCGCIFGFLMASVTPSHDGEPHTEGQLTSRPVERPAPGTAWFSAGPTGTPSHTSLRIVEDGIPPVVVIA